MGDFPVFIQIIILFFWLLVVPVLAGGIFYALQTRSYDLRGRAAVGTGRRMQGRGFSKQAKSTKPAKQAKAAAKGGAEKAQAGGIRKISRRLPQMWIEGQFLLWGLFWLICVPHILIGLDFPYVVYIYGGLSIVLAALGGTFVWRQQGKYVRHGLKVVPEAGTKKSSRVFWVVFALLLLWQLIQAVRLAYGDGDDAYYVAVSSITENADTMYRKLPYTGGTTEVDIRHGLAPFPIWVAFLSRVSGMRAVSVAHVALPLILIPMTYGIFYLLGRKLFTGKEQRIPLFLIFTELLVLFGDYSFYTVENFMLARSRQGKAALGSIVVPMLFLLLYRLLEHLQEKRSFGIENWMLLGCVMLSACLCSTMGALLGCLLLAVAGLCAAVAYRSWRVLVPLGLCCVPGVLCAVIYVMN